MLTAQLIKSPAPVKTQKLPRGPQPFLFSWVRYVKYAVLFGSAAAASSHAEELDTVAPKTDLETYS